MHARSSALLSVGTIDLTGGVMLGLNYAALLVLLFYALSLSWPWGLVAESAVSLSFGAVPFYGQSFGFSGSILVQRWGHS